VIETVLTGASALLMKNPAMADPDNEIVQQIKAITAKGSKMTAEDRARKAELQWFGSLYLNNGEPFIPATNLHKCFAEAGKITRNGTDVERALIPTEALLVLTYPGPRDVSKLWLDKTYRYETMANANPNGGKKKSMVPLMRPMFPKWSIIARWEFFEKALDFYRFLDIAEAAGLTQGLGDNRRNGFGRFHVEVRKV
jgi:hypothetical protein